MFGLLGSINLFKSFAMVAIVVSIGGTIWAGYKYVKDLQIENAQMEKEIATLMANNAQLEQGIKTQQETIKQLRQEFVRQQQIINETLQEFTRTRARVDALESKFAEHDLGFLASKKPKLVENIINKATREIYRCFEIASGKPLTPEELNATLPSQINSQCPELANPNFKGKIK